MVNAAKDTSLSLEWTAYDGFEVHAFRSALAPTAETDLLLSDAVAMLRSIGADLDGPIALRPKVIVIGESGRLVDFARAAPLRIEVLADGFVVLEPEKEAIDPAFLAHMPQSLLPGSSTSRRHVESQVEHPTPAPDNFDNSDKDFDQLRVPVVERNLDFGRVGLDAAGIEAALEQSGRLDLLETALEALSLRNAQLAAAKGGGAL